MSLEDKLKNAEETMWPLTMGMSIGEAISKMRYELNKNNKMADAYAVAIETMRKYQKIEQILKSLDDGEINYPQMTYYIREVLEDGKID